eukprot:10518370-Lingulodinium_polyedra.AAC.1
MAWERRKRRKASVVCNGPEDIWKALSWPETVVDDIQAASGGALEAGSFERMLRHARSGLQ